MTRAAVTDSGDEESALSGSNKQKKIKRTMPHKENRQAEARAELAHKRKERKQQADAAKKAARSASSAASVASAAAAIDPNDPVIGCCDICQMTEKFQKKHMELWRCRKCGVHVHDICYGTDTSRMNQPNPMFCCLACQAKGQTVKVRDRDPYTKEYLQIKQKRRPRECCLCNVKDGSHAMHPVFDAHGPKGRQILLPASKDEGITKRKLAWAHTLCALTLNSETSQTSGALFGCAPNGYCADDDEDPECKKYLSDDDSDNSDLEGEPITGVHHFVYWGYLQKYLGIPYEEWDDWAKSVVKQKTTVRCSVCGKNDKDETTLPGGQRVFQSLRVPLQCFANNDNEHEEFKKYHDGGEHCFVGLHVGCALWGRNDAQEYSQARGSWFFPGLNGVDEKLEQPVVAVYCRCHAEELFTRGVRGSDMEKKLPGPFTPISRTPRKQSAAGKRRPSAYSYDVESHTAETSGRASKPKALTPPTARVFAKPHTSETKAKKRASSKSAAANTASTSPIMHNVSLYGETKKTKKKRAKGMKTAGEAVVVQSKKDGRLASKRNSSALSKGISSAAQRAQQEAEPHVDMVQEILNSMVKREGECIDQGKQFDQSARAILRVQLLQQQFDKSLFHESWNKAKEAFENGIVHVTEQDRAAESLEEDTPMHDDSVPHDEDMETTEYQSTPAADHSHGNFPGVEHEDVESTEADQSVTRHENVEAAEDQATPAVDRNSESPSVDDDPQAELVQQIVDDIAGAMTSEGQTNEQTRDRTVLTGIVRKRKDHWREQSGLSRSDFKALFHGKVAERLERRYGWLKISDKRKIQSATSNDTSDPQQPVKGEEPAHPFGDIPLDQLALKDVEDRPPSDEEPTSEHPGPDPSEDADDRANRDNAASVEDESNDASASHEDGSKNEMPVDDDDLPADENAPPEHTAENPQSQATNKPPSRWSHLHYGPYFRREGYRFGEWETYEEIDTMDSDEE